MNSDLAHDTDTMAWVYADGSITNNGIYRKSGASGSGSWSFALPLPYTYIVASNSGTGTPNPIQATSTVPVTNGMLVSVNITVANTLFPLTIAFNSQSALTAKTRSGQDVGIDGVTPGYILGVRLGSIFYLLSDIAVASQIYAARDAEFAARDAALAAQSGAEAEDRDKAWLRHRNKKLLGAANYKLLSAPALTFVCHGNSFTYGHDDYSSDRIPPVPPNTHDQAAIT